MRLDPRVALLFALVTTFVALSGVLPAAAVLVLGALLAARLGLGWRRFIPLAGAVAPFLLLVPLAPGPAGSAVVKGLAVSVTTLVAWSAARWDRLLAALQTAGLSTTFVAFLSIVFSHVERTGRDTSRAVDGLVLRGGFRGVRGLLASTHLVLARTLQRAFERADRTAEALELRGFVGRLPALGPLRIGPADVTAMAAAGVSVVFVAVTRWPWGR